MQSRHTRSIRIKSSMSYPILPGLLFPVIIPEQNHCNYLIDSNSRVVANHLENGIQIVIPVMIISQLPERKDMV